MTRPVVVHVCAVEYSARTLLVPQLDFLEQRGFDVRLACAPEQSEFHPELARFQPVRIGFSRKIDPLGTLRAAREFGAFVRRLQPDLVHLHSPAAALAARLLPRALLGRRRPKIVFTVHGFPFLWSELARPRNRALELMERTLARRTDLMLFQSREDFDEASRRGYRSNLRYLGNGVEPRWFEPFPPPGTAPRLRLLFAGRLTREKGVLDVIEAVARVPDVELVIAGGRLDSERDDITPELDAFASDPRLEGRLTLLGSMPPSEMTRVMAGADVFVLASAREGVPRSIIEAMAAGRPVITTRIRGCTELVDDGVNGWLVNTHDPADLAATIEQIAKEPRQRLRAMGEVGQRRAVDGYSERQVLGRLVAAYAELGVRPSDSV
ncbi:MAG TPA: glycosyltransferase [Acidimicrobiales bacterium]|nr:glycosyltransferase [Acidimicrobiales bacterium]